MRIIFVLLVIIPFYGLSQINQTDPNGLRQGFWQKMQENGKLLYEGNFKDGKPVGEWKRYHPGGALKAFIVYHADTAKTQLFDETGKKIAEGDYINQKKEGEWIYFSDNQIISTEEFWGGQKNGLAKTFYKSGELMETCEWKDNQKSGTYQLFFQTGEPYLQCKMENNKRHGLCLVRFKNGLNELEAEYKNGLRHGEWKYYNEKGEFLYTLFYDSSKLLNPETLDSIENAQFKALEKNKQTLIDPEKYMDNPSEYMLKMKIYKE